MYATYMSIAIIVLFNKSRIQDESLRWLAANGKREAADKVMHKVARWNKINYDELKKIVDKKMDSIKPDTHKVNETETTTNSAPSHVVEKYSALTILRNKSIFLISLILWFIWYLLFCLLIN